MNSSAIATIAYADKSISQKIVDFFAAWKNPLDRGRAMADFYSTFSELENHANFRVINTIHKAPDGSFAISTTTNFKPEFGLKNRTFHSFDKKTPTNPLVANAAWDRQVLIVNNLRTTAPAQHDGLVRQALLNDMSMNVYGNAILSCSTSSAKSRKFVSAYASAMTRLGECNSFPAEEFEAVRELFELFRSQNSSR